LWLAAPEDFEILLEHLGEMSSAYGVRLFAYTLMSSHIHLLLQSPDADVLGRPMRWFMTQTAKTFHRLRNRCGHFWERRYRACLVEDDLYVHYRAILAPGSDPHVDDRDSRWTSQRAVGSPEFLKRHHPSGRQQGTIPLPEQIRKVRK
jgi:hypothetical protein